MGSRPTKKHWEAVESCVLDKYDGSSPTTSFSGKAEHSAKMAKIDNNKKGKKSDRRSKYFQ